VIPLPDFMSIVSKEEVLKSKRKYLKLLDSSVFIYPTDSIYGLGCDATNKELVQKIRRMKKSNLQSFSIIAPSKKWVYENCEVGERQKVYVEKLGSKINIVDKKHCFTIILKLKNKDAVAKNVTQGVETIGVRIPDHWFSEIVADFGKPIITTSANPTGENFMTSLEDLNDKIKKAVDFIIYEGEKKGHPSTIIQYEDKLKVKDRSK